jgi:hypothetical protein
MLIPFLFISLHSNNVMKTNLYYTIYTLSDLRSVLGKSGHTFFASTDTASASASEVWG